MWGMIILGPAGAGKTSVGKLVAQELGIAFLDIDDYIWRTDTEVPYTVMFSRPERIHRLMDAARKAGEFVMAGSMDSFHQYFDPFFRLAVYLTADAALRVARVRRREEEEFGPRVLPGGDMYQNHQAFLQDAAGYETAAASCTRERHEAWLGQLACPVLRLDGAQPLEKNAAAIANAYRKTLDKCVQYGADEDLDSWMALVERVAWNFPGLETPEALAQHRQTVQRFMGEKRALCVKEDGAVVGVLLFSRKHNMLCCLAVSPDHRRQGIASRLLREAMERMDSGRDMTVTTFRQEDAKGDAPRALYKRFGFEEGELLLENGYPVQRFVRKAGRLEEENP